MKEFLRDELKFDADQMMMLKDFKVSRRDVEENDKVYIILENVELAEYIYRKAAICKNDNVNIFPFVPPQIFRRYTDLSRNAFKLRKADTRIKTKIELGHDDLIMKSKINLYCLSGM